MRARWSGSARRAVHHAATEGIYKGRMEAVWA